MIKWNFVIFIFELFFQNWMKLKSELCNKLVNEQFDQIWIQSVNYLNEIPRFLVKRLNNSRIDKIELCV